MSGEVLAYTTMAYCNVCDSETSFHAYGLCFIELSEEVFLVKSSLLIIGESITRKITFGQTTATEVQFKNKTFWHLNFPSRGLDPRAQEGIDSVHVAKVAFAQ